MDNRDMPVFPVTDSNHELGTCASDGPTKRELFAAMAMQGLLSRHGGSDVEFKYIVDDSVNLAEQLIAELNKEQANAN